MNHTYIAIVNYTLGGRNRMQARVNSRGTLPSIRSIHENSYAWHHTSLDDINKLLQITPCTLGGVYRWMPIMYAVRNGAIESVVRRLVKEQPQAVRLSDCDGWLPIHYSQIFLINLATFHSSYFFYLLSSQ